MARVCIKGRSALIRGPGKLRPSTPEVTGVNVYPEKGDDDARPTT